MGRFDKSCLGILARQSFFTLMLVEKNPLLSQAIKRTFKVNYLLQMEQSYIPLKVKVAFTIQHHIKRRYSALSSPSYPLPSTQTCSSQIKIITYSTVHSQTRTSIYHLSGVPGRVGVVAAVGVAVGVPGRAVKEPSRSFTVSKEGPC